MNISKHIVYQEEISEEDFKEFLDVLKKKDPEEFEKESKDGFLDLYNYWCEAGIRKMQIKLRNNKATLGI